MERIKEPTKADRKWAAMTVKKLIIRTKTKGSALKLLLKERGRDYEDYR